MANEKVTTPLERAVEQARKAREARQQAADVLCMAADSLDPTDPKWLVEKAVEHRDASRAQVLAMRKVGEEYLDSIRWGGDR